MYFKEALYNYWYLTALPTLRRMFSKRRRGNTLLLMGTFFLIAAMLSVICLSHHVNLQENERLSEEYTAYITSTAHSAGKEDSEAAKQAYNHILYSKIELNSVFVFLMIVWGILAAFSLARVFHATVERDKYVYGLYVTFGSDTRQIRRQIYTEFLIAALIALVIAIPTATVITATVYHHNGQRFSAGLSPYLQILLWLFAVSLIGAGYLARQITRSTCVELMTARDCSDYTVSPRASRPLGRHIRNGAMRYARLALQRMRRYYIPLVLTVSVVAAVFFGSMNLALGGEREAAESILEYTIEFSGGLSSDQLASGYLTHLMNVDDVQSVDAIANGSAELLGTHLMAEKSLFKPSEEDMPVDCGSYFATEDIRILCADGNTRAELGGDVVLPTEWKSKAYCIERTYNYTQIPEPGSVVYLYPQERAAELNVSVGDTLQLAVPKSDGEGKTLEEKLADGMYDYLSVTVSQVLEIPGVHYTTPNEAIYICPRITDDFLLLSPQDYAVISRGETVEALSLDELYREDLRFGNLNNPAVLLLPEDYDGVEPTVIQMFEPTASVTERYSVEDPLDDHNVIYLESDEFYLNRTAYHSYFYFGSAGELDNDADASDRLMHMQSNSLTRHRQKELTVVDHIVCPGLEEPCIILPNDGFLSSFEGDLCILRLQENDRILSVREEIFALGTNLPLAQTDYLGKQMFSHTKIRAGFFDEMKAQGLYTNYPKESAYELSTFYVMSVFALGNTNYFLLRLSPYCNLGIDQYPAYLTPGNDFVFLTDLDDRSDMTLSVANSYLLLDETFRRKGVDLTSVTAGEFYATNELTVSVADEINIGNLTPKVSAFRLEGGQAVLVLGRNSMLDVQVGDLIRMAIRGEFYLDPNDPQLAMLSGNDLLRYMKERHIPFEYAAVRLVDVIQGEGEEDVIYLSEEDWQRILRRDSTYQSLDIHLFGDTDLVGLIKTSARIRALMGNWQSTENRVTLIEHNRLWSAVTTGACNYPAIIRTLSILLILLLPLLWCAPQTMHFHKRQEEFEVMCAVGRTRVQIRRMIALECLLITLASGIFVALLCPFSVLCIQAAIYFLELPFVLSDFDAKAYLFMIFFVMLCSALSYLTAARYLSGRGNKKAKKGADPV